MSMSNFSTKENTNVESKSENESEIQDEPQKCENFTDFLFKTRKKHSNKIIMAHININSPRNKFDMLTNSVTEYIDIKLDQNFDNFEGFFIELESSKKNKWLLSYSYNPHKTTPI